MLQRRQEPSNLRHPQAIDRQPHVDLYTPTGRRLARLYGEDAATLQARVERWRAHISRRLDARWP